jgi:hypothetical protein
MMRANCLAPPDKGCPRFSAYFDRDPTGFGTFRAFDFD